MLHLHLKACLTCHGDLALDEGDWLCLQCGRYRYTRRYPKPAPLPAADAPTGDQREKTASITTSSLDALTRFPRVAATAYGGRESKELGSSGLAAGWPVSPASFGPGATGIGGPDEGGR